MDGEVYVVLSTFPEVETARRIARQLVHEKLAACANILPGIESIYRWKGGVEESAEVLALFKTAVRQYAAFEAKLKQLHPYEVPEIVALPVSTGLDTYLSWVGESCA